jgi:hypothetical protein
MPGGATAIAYAAFCGVKLAGYTVYCSYFRRINGKPGVNPVLFGLAGTALGMAVGYGVFVIANWLFDSMTGFLSLLMSVRIVECC